MQRVMGRRGPAALTRSSLLGMASSSCSYAASALAKSLFQRGADFTAAMVFMFASTNLVAELGIVLWLLIGWQFTLAEFVGGGHHDRFAAASWCPGWFRGAGGRRAGTAGPGLGRPGLGRPRLSRPRRSRGHDAGRGRRRRPRAPQPEMLPDGAIHWPGGCASAPAGLTRPVTRSLT